jgi:hypothetical protein
MLQVKSRAYSGAFSYLLAFFTPNNYIDTGTNVLILGLYLLN